ncbi:MAG: PLP-dependent aminotransferase family protein, partial [Vicinamibacteria bacterium]|nr:PLP-dependent aminotransferase family protein [Vicinamibacteria bacterium]
MEPVQFQEGRLYTRVARRLASLIERGTLRPGDRLPSLRRTSVVERVSVSTSLQAYSLLEMRGYVEARPQSGFYVRPHASREMRVPAASRTGRSASPLDASDGVSRVLQSAHDRRLVAFGAACPAPSLLPTRALARLVSSIGRARVADTNAYSFPPGREELRQEIARRAIRWGGALAPDDVLITCGATEALSLALMATTRRGDIVAVESPCYFGTLLLLDSLGLRAIAVATDPIEGMLVDDLAAVLRNHRVAAIVASPTCQNPLGSVMTDEAKRAVAALLARHDVPLIEDDVYGEAFHGPERPAPVKAWDRGGRVLWCSSFSKVLAPGYRIGWIAGGRYQERLKRLKFANTLATPAVPQLAIAAFLRSGSHDRFMKGVRASYRDQVERGREAVARFFPKGTRVTQPQGGFLLWIEMA